METCDTWGIAYVITKYGNLYVIELSTPQLLCVGKVTHQDLVFLSTKHKVHTLILFFLNKPARQLEE
jgi:hypothetical protein